MADEDPIDDLQGSMNMALMSAARVSETVLRSSQERKSSQADQASRDAASAIVRFEAQAVVAEEFYKQASTPEFVRTERAETVAAAWRGAQKWREFDEDRIGPHADRMAASIREVHDLDPSDPAQLDQLSDGVRVQRGTDAELDQQRQDDGVDLEADPGVAAGLEYDSAPSRQAREEQINQSDFHPEVKVAMKMADHQNGRDPAEAAGAGGGSRTGRAVKRAAARDRSPATRGR